MSLQKQRINSEEEYKNFAERFYFLVDRELSRAEEMKDKNDHHGLAYMMPAVVSAVNTIGYLRGQDGMFYNFRPYVAFQKELYQAEDECEKRLFELINYLKTTQSKDSYKFRMEEYYLRNRGLRE